MPDKATRHLTAAAITVGILATAVILIWGLKRPPQYAVDDAYITYRYADNLRQGLGLVYNPGEWVLGTTAPFYALLLTVLSFLISDLEVLGHWLGVLSWVLSSWAAILFFRHSHWPRAGLVAGLLLAFLPLFALSLGMETPLVVALMLWVAWAWFGGHKWLAVCLATALLLTRQDTSLWLLLLGLEVWRRQGTLPWREAITVSLLSAPWFVFAWWRYGSILPNSVSAKIGQNEFMPVSGSLPFWQGLWQTGTTGFTPIAIAALTLVLLLGLWLVLRQARHFWWLLSWFVMYVVVYTWLNVVNFSWYFLPPLVTVALFIALAIGYMLGDGQGKLESHYQRSHYQRSHYQCLPNPAHRWPYVEHLLPALGLIFLSLFLLQQGRQVELATTQRGYRAAYLAVGQWLADHTTTQANVAAIEIGVIGYVSQRPVLDTMGLVSPDMSRHQRGWAETLVYALTVHRPDYAVTLPGTAWDQVVDRWWFQQQYKPVAHFDGAGLYRRAPSTQVYETPLTIAFVNGLTLTGVSFSEQELRPSSDLAMSLHVDVQAVPAGDYLFTVYLVDAQTFARFAITTVAPFDGRYRSQHWQVGDKLAIPARLTVPAGLAPGVYRLGILIYDPERDGGLPLRDVPDGLNPDIQIGWLRLGLPPLPSESEGIGMIEQPLFLRWQEGVALTAIKLPAGPLAPGDTLPLYFTWQASQTISRDLTFFIHLVDAEGNIIAQQDRRPLDGRWPTPAWRPGDVLYDGYQLELPNNLMPGQYGLRLGFYDAAGRLPLAEDNNDNWLLPGAITIIQSAIVQSAIIQSPISTHPTR